MCTVLHTTCNILTEPAASTFRALLPCTQRHKVPLKSVCVCVYVHAHMPDSMKCVCVYVFKQFKN
jgi:hypothetical protein